MSAYLYIMKMRMMASIAYRFDVFASIGSTAVFLAASVYLWKVAYHGIAVVSDVAEQQMIVYTVISILLGSFYQTGVQNTINSRIREGDIAVDMMRPMLLLGQYGAEDAGVAFSSLLNKVLPLLVFASLLFSVPVPAGPAAFALFVASCLLGSAIVWLMSAIVGLSAFWVTELGNLGIVKDAVVRVLSGSLVPLWFFPQPLQTVSAFLPFMYTYQTPVGIYIGKIGPAEAAKAMLVQGVWVVLLFLLLVWIWRRARLKTHVQGG